MLQAGFVSVGVMLGLSVTGFALLNIGLIGIWLFAATSIAREHKTLSAVETP